MIPGASHDMAYEVSTRNLSARPEHFPFLPSTLRFSRVCRSWQRQLIPTLYFHNFQYTIDRFNHGAILPYQDLCL